MSQVNFNKVSKIYNENTDHEVKALDEVSFQIEKGECVVVLGSSGAGKSTLLNILGGMDTLTRGEFIVENQNVAKFNDKQLEIYRRSNIGFVFQFYNLMPNLTALENIQIAESLSENPLDSHEVIKSVGLENRARNFPSELSGGEQQRVAIARAIVKNPTLLLCDEPTGALDSKTGTMIIKLLCEICEKYQKTVVIVTHNNKIAEVANRLIRIQDGKIVENKVNTHPIKPSDIAW
ncbi:MAG: ABC transporter ATP-binding protein [Bacilli bacterium]|nr:ABC transporter ATP-binding protein [Bacilli bacterium]